MSPVEDEQGPLVVGPEVGDIYTVGTDLCFRMPDLRRLEEEVDELMGLGVPTTRGTSACASGDSRGETCDTQTQQCFIGE